jgi:hypothetical protein
MLLKEVFGGYRIAALAGDKSTGKTNNLMALLKDFREHNKETPIYVYGIDEPTLEWAKKELGKVYEFSSLDQLTNKRNCLVVADEFQKLKLADKRHISKRDAFVDFIYHNNNWAILSSPNLREFNSIIGTIVERWLLKSMKSSSLINGSQLKKTVEAYGGRYKVLENIDLPYDKMIIVNSDYEKVISLKYLKEIDRKPEYVDIFDAKKKSEKSP